MRYLNVKKYLALTLVAAMTFIGLPNIAFADGWGNLACERGTSTRVQELFLRFGSNNYEGSYKDVDYDEDDDGYYNLKKKQKKSKGKNKSNKFTSNYSGFYENKIGSLRWHPRYNGHDKDGDGEDDHNFNGNGYGHYKICSFFKGNGNRYGHYKKYQDYYYSRDVDDVIDTEILAAVTLDSETVKVLFNRKMEGTTGEVTSETNPPTNPWDADSYGNYILIDRNTSTSGDGKIMVISASMEDGAKSVILNLTSNLSSGHTYDLYANASKAISSTNSILVDDPHTDLAAEDKFDTVGLRSDNNLPLNASNATVEVDVDEPSVLEVRIIDAAQEEYRVIFSEVVEFSKVEPFTILDADGAASTIVIGQGYEDGDEVTFDDNIFVDALEFTATNLVKADSNVLVLDGTMTNKIGIVVPDGTELETFVGAGATGATLESTIGIVNDNAETITGVPHGTTLAVFKAAITPEGEATFEVYETDGITVATDLLSTYKVIVTAEDGITTKTYVVTVSDDLVAATAAVVVAEASETQADVDTAQDLVTALADSTEKTALQVRIDAVQSIIDAALAAINGGTEVFADFMIAGVKGAIEANKAAYDTVIAAAIIIKGSDLTLAEVQTEVDDVNAAVVAAIALEAINGGTEVFADFMTAGVTGAVEANKAAYDTVIAAAIIIKGSDLTLLEVQAEVDGLNAALATIALAAINGGTEVFADFMTAGVTGAIEANKAAYDTAIAAAKVLKGSDLILLEVQAEVDGVNAIIALAAINGGTEVFADFITAGVTGAVEANKAAYDTMIAATIIIKGSDLTLLEVQAEVDTVNSL